MSYFTANLTEIEEQIRAELQAQDAKWGEQNHPDRDPRYDSDAAEYAWSARHRQKINAKRAQPTTTSQCDGRCPDSRFLHTHTAWDGVLLEEVYEALAETDPVKLRAELIQVAAVAVQWAKAIDRRSVAGQADGGAR